MNPSKIPSTGEKTLFLSLWGIIILVVSMWWLWPQPVSNTISSPEIELARNITPIFSTAQVTPSATLADFRVTLRLSEEYLKDLQGESKQLELGVRLLSEQSVLEETKVFCLLTPGEPLTHLSIPNPQRFHPKRLLLYLGH